MMIEQKCQDRLEMYRSGKRNSPFVRKTFEVDEEDGCLA
jgi:hypothetical protein